MPRRLSNPPDTKPQVAVFVEEEEVRVVMPEGQEIRMSLADLFEKSAALRPTACGQMLPPGVKCVLETSSGLIAVHQTPPRTYSFRWIANDSFAMHGPGTRYRDVRIGLPYLVLLAVFERGPRGILTLSSRNEAFFVNQPLEIDGMDTKLGFPALLNCSKVVDDGASPLAWICTQHLRVEDYVKHVSPERRLEAGVRALHQHLLETGFNLSSEVHEVSSWFSETVKRKIDERISSVEAWERATLADPRFALEVPWVPTKKTLRQVAERIAQGTSHRNRQVRTRDDIARIAVASQRRSRSKK